MGFFSYIAGLFGVTKPPPPALAVESTARESLRAASSGTRISGGRIQGIEKNPDLSGPGVWAEHATEMLRTDPHLRGLDRALRNTLLSATIAAELPPSAVARKSKRARERAKRNARRNTEFINSVFGWDGHPGQMDLPWESYMARIVMFPSYGFRVMEEVYRLNAEGLVVLKELFDTTPESIYRWIPDVNTGDLAYILQRPWAQGERQPRPIPANKALVFSMERQGRNYEGNGLLRPCWSAYRGRQHLWDQLLVGATRWAMPIPQVTVEPLVDDTGQPIDHATTIDAQRAELEETAINLVSGLTSHVSATQNVKLETYGEGAFKGVKELLEAIVQLGREQSFAYLANHMELGVQDTGSRAVGETHHDAYLASVINIMDAITNTLTQCVRRLLQVNFYGVGVPVPPDEMPVIRHRGLEVDGLAQALKDVATLVSAGVLENTPELRARIAALMGVPVTVETDDDASQNKKAKGVNGSGEGDDTNEGAEEALEDESTEDGKAAEETFEDE